MPNPSNETPRMPTNKESQAVKLCARLQFVSMALSSLLTPIAVPSHRPYPLVESGQLGMFDSVSGNDS
jgi:hypothetical protein